MKKQGVGRVFMMLGQGSLQSRRVVTQEFCPNHSNVITPKESDVTIEGNVLNVEMAPKTFVLYKFVKASNK